MNEHGVHNLYLDKSLLSHEYLYNISGIPINPFIYIASSKKVKNAFKINITITQNSEIHAEALIDSGAYSCFINYAYAKANNLVTQRLEKTIKVFNADGTKNKGG